jgi:tetratricopeptide (TPR) repeat protein
MTNANSLKEHGLELFQQDKLAEAAEQFLEAARMFEAEGQPASAAEMMNNVCVVRLAEKDWAAALAAVQGTPKLFAQHNLPLRQAQALGNLAAAHDGAGHLDEAAALYEQAIDLYKTLGETENRAACWKALSGLQIKQDNKLQAMASMQAGLDLQTELSPKEKTLKGLLDQAFKLMDGRR